MVKGFIPVEAIVNGNNTVWYMDVNALSLNELITLKNELKGSKVESIVPLDAIIHETINWNRQDLKAQRRESQKNKGLYKNSKALVKKKRMGR